MLLGVPGYVCKFIYMGTQSALSKLNIIATFQLKSEAAAEQRRCQALVSIHLALIDFNRLEVKIILNAELL